MQKVSRQDSASPPGYLLLVLLLGSLTAFGPLSIDMYLPSLPAIAKDFAVPLSSVQFSLTAFFIGLALGQVFYGPISDRFGRKKPIYFGLGVYTLASAGCALAGSSEQLIALRLLQALGSCAGMVGSKAIVRDLFAERDSAKVFSMLMLVMGLAPILAPLAGGYISAAFGWRAIFALLSVLGVICLTALALLLPETRSPNPSVKLTRSLHIFADIMRNPTFLKYAVAGGSAQAGMFAYITGSPFVFIEYYGLAPESYAWIFGINAFALIALSQANVFILSRFQPEQILTFAFMVLLTMGLGLFSSAYWSWSMYVFGGMLIVSIAILGITFPNTTAVALASEGHRAGSASALLGTLQFTLAALASAAVSYFHNGTALAMSGVMMVCGLLALGFGLLPVRARPETQIKL